MCDDIPDVSLIRKEDAHMRKLVMKTLASVRNWLMSCCVEFRSAQMYNRRANASARDNRGYMVRMKTEKIGHDNIIDVSSKEAQKAFFPWKLRIVGQICA